MVALYICTYWTAGAIVCILVRYSLLLRVLICMCVCVYSKWCARSTYACTLATRETGRRAPGQFFAVPSVQSGFHACSVRFTVCARRPKLYSPVSRRLNIVFRWILVARTRKIYAEHVIWCNIYRHLYYEFLRTRESKNSAELKYCIKSAWCTYSIYHFDELFAWVHCSASWRWIKLRARVHQRPDR